jgi:RNA ligase (TIGR02306 family)
MHDKRCNAAQQGGCHMADFRVLVERLTIEEHPNADRLELARVGDYQSIVLKGQFVTGDLAAYIPEAALVPEEILEELGLTGRLAGPDANRVKAIRLRSVLSQGIVYPAREGWSEGDDVTEELGITKYEPPVPTNMSGELYPAGYERCMRYDIENFKRYPDVLAHNEEVVFTEKLHGTWCQLGVLPEALAGEHGRLVVTSKGLGAKGLAFLPEAESNANNLYLRVARALDIVTRVGDREEPLFILGEVFGSGVQDLSYGANAGQDDTLGFRVFDVYEGSPGQGRYLNDAELDDFCSEHELERVPVLYRGPFSREVMLEWTDGKESVSGDGLHIREGIVIRPSVERRDDRIGRVQLKSVSEDYLLRKGGTEYN